MNDALDLLDRLSVGAIKEAALYKDRPQDRFGATHFKADILGSGTDLQVTTRRPVNSNFDQTGVWLSIDVREILVGKGELGEQQLWIRIPGARRDGSATQAEDNSEYARMLLAANESDASITSLRMLPGRKNVEFKEDVHKYTQRQRNDNTGVWSDADRTTFFYRLNFRAGTSVVSGNGSNSAGVVQPKPSEVAVQRALDMIKEAGTDGIKEAEFNLQASKDPVIKADKAMAGYLASGKLVSDNADKVKRNGVNVVWVGAE